MGQPLRRRGSWTVKQLLLHNVERGKTWRKVWTASGVQEVRSCPKVVFGTPSVLYGWTHASRQVSLSRASCPRDGVECLPSRIKTKWRLGLQESCYLAILSQPFDRRLLQLQVIHKATILSLVRQYRVWKCLFWNHRDPCCGFDILIILINKIPPPPCHVRFTQALPNLRMDEVSRQGKMSITYWKRNRLAADFILCNLVTICS